MEASISTANPDRPTEVSMSDPQSISGQPSFFVEALYAFNGTDTSSLSFRKGDIIEVLTQLSSGWWDGVIWRQRERGWFPSNYVKRITDEEADQARARLDAVMQQQDSFDSNTFQDLYSQATASLDPSRLSLTSSVWDGRGLINDGESKRAEDPLQTDERPTITPHPSVDGAGTFELAPQPPLPHRANLATAHPPGYNPVSGNWIDWLPRVTDAGQIYYYNAHTGEVASEMPSAGDELDFESFPDHQSRGAQSKAAISPIGPVVSPSEIFDEDPIKFLEEHGFGITELSAHGILSSAAVTSAEPRKAETLVMSALPPSQAARLLNEQIDTRYTQASGNSIDRCLHVRGASLSSSALLAMRSDTNPALSTSPESKILTESHSSSLLDAARTLGSHGSDRDDGGETARIGPSTYHPNSRRTGSKSKLRLLANYKHPQFPASADVFSVSAQILGSLQGIAEIPPTLTFPRMATEVKRAISLLARLTAPASENVDLHDPNHTELAPIGLQLMTDDVRDGLSEASMNLVDKIRYMLQASCQLDTAVLSMLQDSSTTASFASPSSTFPRPSLMQPISPHPQLIYPDLKHVTRKIASTLSKLTLSTRALWGLLSTSMADSTAQNDLRSPTNTETASGDIEVTSESQLQTIQTRYALEQKLRCECKMSVSDLSSNVEAFFHHFEGLIQDKLNLHNLNGTSGDLHLALQFPRHGRGHLTMSIESALSPGGPKGGNWAGSGFDKLPAHMSQSPSSDGNTVLAGVTYPLLSTRPPNPPSLKIEADWLSQRFFPLTRRAIEICGSLNNLLSYKDDEAIYLATAMSSLELSPLDDTSLKIPETRLDTVLEQIFELIELSSAFLGVAESLDISASMEVDRDRFLWYDVSRNLGAKDPATITPEALRLATTQLQSARRLVDVFMGAKQILYDTLSELVQVAQMVLTSGGSFWFPQTPSPAQPPSASPLFTIPPSSAPDNISPAQLVETLGRFSLYLQSFNKATRSLIQEAKRQSDQDINLSNLTLTVKDGVCQRQTSNRQQLSATEQTELDSRSRDPTRRASMTAGSVWSHRTSSTKSERSLDQIRQAVASTDRSSHPNENDRNESGSSRSPTRSKKVAKFFGEEAATQVMPPNKAPTSSKPAFLTADYGPEDISFNPDGQVRGGTLKGLVIKLTSHEGPDVSFLRVFLMTYRTFATSHDFLDILIERYHQAPPPNLNADELKLWSDQKQKVIKIRVINVMRSWIESHLSDEDAEGIIQRVTEFAARDMGDTNLARQVALTCERRQSRSALMKMSPVNPPGNPPPPILPRNLRKIKFLDIDPLELARQLSLVESRLFCKIQVNECLGKAWPKEFAKEGTPNIKAMIDMSNALTRWVAETILLQPEQKKRAGTIKHFILIADRCRSLNNFSTLMQIIAGLNSTPIYRLRRTWETIPQKTLTLFAQLGTVMSPTKNYATYRDTIRNMAPPCVPFVGVYLTDWTFIGDGNPDQLREKPHQINFNKRQKAAELIVQIQSYQSMPFQLTPVPVIVKFLEDSLENPRDEKELYDMSLEIEPRERDDEKIARLLAESGFL